MSREVQLTLENLKDLDFGKIGAAFNAELAHVTKDCLDRPGDTKCRKVSIMFILVPTPDTIGNGQPGDVIHVGCEISSSVPKRRTRIYEMSPRVNGMLTFHPESPEDPRADLLYDNVDRETGEIT